MLLDFVLSFLRMSMLLPSIEVFFLDAALLKLSLQDATFSSRNHAILAHFLSNLHLVLAVIFK